MPISTGHYGTVFEFQNLSHSEMPVQVRTAAGETVEIPTSDLMRFAQDLVKNHDEPPIQVNEKVAKYIQAAIDAATDGDKEIIGQLRQTVAAMEADVRRWNYVRDQLTERHGAGWESKM